MKFISSSPPRTFFMGVFTGFCFSVLITYIMLASDTTLIAHRRLRAAAMLVDSKPGNRPRVESMPKLEDLPNPLSSHNNRTVLKSQTEANIETTADSKASKRPQVESMPKLEDLPNPLSSQNNRTVLKSQTEANIETTVDSKAGKRPQVESMPKLEDLPNPLSSHNNRTVLKSQTDANIEATVDSKAGKRPQVKSMSKLEDLPNPLSSHNNRTVLKSQTKTNIETTADSKAGKRPQVESIPKLEDLPNLLSSHNNRTVLKSQTEANIETTVDSKAGKRPQVKSMSKLKNITKHLPSHKIRTALKSHKEANKATIQTKAETPLQRYVTNVRFHSGYVNCKRIFDGNVHEIARAVNYRETHNHSFPDSDFIPLTKDCNAFKMKLGYIRNYSKEEIDFPLAFGILTYQNIEQVERLLRVIYAPHNVYCIHVDAKSPAEFLNAVRSLSNCFPNVFVTSRLERVIYAHFSRLRAEINCIEDLLKRSSTWKYFLNLASSEIPLKTNLEIIKYLKSINGHNDISETVKRRGPARYIYRHVPSETEEYVIRTQFKLTPPPHNLSMTKGQAYGAFTRKFLEFVLINRIARDFLEWSKDIYSPDEYYWATLNNLYSNPFLNSPGGSKDDPQRTKYNGRHIKWKLSNANCKGTLRHNICVYGVGDLVDLKSSKYKLVANKFNVDFDPFAVACMEEYLTNKTKAEMKQK